MAEWQNLDASVIMNNVLEKNPTTHWSEIDLTKGVVGYLYLDEKAVEVYIVVIAAKDNVYEDEPVGPNLVYVNREKFVHVVEDGQIEQISHLGASVFLYGMMMAQ